MNIYKNIKGMRFTLLEYSGSLGDLGTFIPLTASVALVTGMDIGIILIFAGLFNILTGIMFGLPLPVQPMKAIAAVAIVEQLLPGEIAAAGFTVGILVFVLGVTGWIERLDKFIPKSVIRGIQLGIGLKLAIKAIELIGQTEVLGLDSVTTALALGTTAVLFYNSKQFPTALLLFIIGVSITIWSAPFGFDSYRFGLPDFSFSFPSAEMWSKGITLGAIPQLPLTLLNSVIAVRALSGDLFPESRLRTKEIATSVGLMNLLSCGFGAFPMCHGSGGLAGQYHFGARTGGSVVILGVEKLLFGLFLGSTAMQMLIYFPHSVLGILLLFAGIELALPARDQRRLDEFVIMIITVIGILSINTSIGFLLGMITYSLITILTRENKTDS